MQVVGITGTNGKTTTAYLIASIFEAAGVRCGVLGTVGYRIGDEMREATRTTPEAPDVQALLREMVDRGCGACAMEVSSHALSLRRVDGMTFAAGVFTNLTRDHLDFHARHGRRTSSAKRRLFEMLPRDAPSLINLDDPRGAGAGRGRRPAGDLRDQPAGRHHARAAVVLARRAGVRRPHAARHAARALDARRPAERLQHPRGGLDRRRRSTLPFDAIERGIAALDGVPGRFQVVSSPKDEVTVVVDYAHTDDALRNLLETARPLARGPADHGVRLRRRSRSHEASADGRRRRPAERS